MNSLKKSFNIHDLSVKITLIFLLAFVSLVLFFIFYLNSSQKKIDKQALSQHQKFSHYFRDNKIHPHTIEDYLKNFSFSVEENARFIFDNAHIIGKSLVFESFEYQKNYYFHVRIHGFRKMFKDNNSYKNHQLEYLGFAFVFILLIIMYLWLLASIRPLHTLKNHITSFAEGNLDINCSSSKKDEIAIVSNEFNHAVQKIKLLLSSRQLFLRTVMHELKTPIAKGRIVSELIDDEKQKNRLIFIFEKLEYLINDFAKIEEIVSNNYEIKPHSYRASLVVDNAIEMLLLDKNSDKITRIQNCDVQIKVDFELMSLVIKNLVDNALKYASDGLVHINEDKNSLSILSNGEALNRPIEAYFKPFHNETDMSRQGMGLGLYIVKSILDMHGMHLNYIHLAGVNCFELKYEKSV